MLGTLTESSSIFYLLSCIWLIIGLSLRSSSYPVGLGVTYVSAKCDGFLSFSYYLGFKGRGEITVFVSSGSPQTSAY